MDSDDKNQPIMKRRKPLGPVTARWERGYRAHSLRDPKGTLLGRVELVGYPARGYLWRAAACQGSCASLIEAKQYVEEVLRRGIEQLVLPL